MRFSKSSRAMHKDAISFLRPDDLPRGDVPAETARATQFLRFRQIGLASPQLLLHFLSIVNISVQGVPADDLTKSLLARAEGFLGVLALDRHRRHVRGLFDGLVVLRSWSARFAPTNRAVDGFHDALPDGRVVFNYEHFSLHGVLRCFSLPGK